MFKRLSIFLYGVVSYAIFFGTFLYALGFVGNFAVPRTLDGVASTSFTSALLVDLGLLGLFAIQHSVMARPAFKRWFTRLVPVPAERSTYVLLSSLALIAMFALVAAARRRRLDSDGSDRARRALGLLRLWLAAGAGIHVPHQPLRPLRPAPGLAAVDGRPYTELAFGTPGPYRLVRHPLYVGWLFAFWATPTMTISHLVFAIATTGYILIAIQLEERDLVAHHGKAYQDYRDRVPMLIPFTRKRNLDDPFLRRQRS